MTDKPTFHFVTNPDDGQAGLQRTDHVESKPVHSCMAAGCGGYLEQKKDTFSSKCSVCGKKWRKEVVYYQGFRRDISDKEHQWLWDHPAEAIANWLGL